MEEYPRHWEAGKCLEILKDAVGLSEFGYRIQGLAAHILLRLGAKVLKINSQGHPDIIAEAERGLIRIEVEADAGRSRPRMLTREDLNSIAPRLSVDKGYFALAICSAYPRWILIEYAKLERRHGTPAFPAVLDGLADNVASQQWTREFIKLLIEHGKRLHFLSYDNLARRALRGEPL